MWRRALEPCQTRRIGSWRGKLGYSIRSAISCFRRVVPPQPDVLAPIVSMGICTISVRLTNMIAGGTLRRSPRREVTSEIEG